MDGKHFETVTTSRQIEEKQMDEKRRNLVFMSKDIKTVALSDSGEVPSYEMPIAKPIDVYWTEEEMSRIYDGYSHLPDAKLITYDDLDEQDKARCKRDF